MAFRKVKVELFPHEKHVTSIYKYLQNTLPAWRWDTISIGHCGWANAPDCWWIRFNATTKQRRQLIEWINENGIELYNPMTIV